MRVSDVAGVAGFVLPGLRVDVLVTGRPDGAEGTITTTCLQNILVLSAGQTIQPDGRGQAINTPTVTLLVTPQQAETLTLAGNEGRIQLVLRNSSDQATEKTSWHRHQRLIQRTAGGRRSRKAGPSQTRTSQARSRRRCASAASRPGPSSRKSLLSVGISARLKLCRRKLTR